MGVFKSERRFWTQLTDLAPVAEHVSGHFRGRGFEVLAQPTATGAWDIDITRAGTFRAISGMRTAMKVRLEPESGAVLARAGIGILGQQALPTVVSMVVFWPILVTQIWGAVQASKLDDEALSAVEGGIALVEGGGVAAAAGPAVPIQAAGGFCGQ
ncbi:MAG: hypothetical protein ACM30G_02500, partial [Micromonosporaceae bacterium]